MSTDGCQAESRMSTIEYQTEFRISFDECQSPECLLLSDR